MSRLHWVIEGQGPVVMLSHALGCDLHMWDEVAALLREGHTVLRYDHRGHGRSPGGSRPFSVEDLADDAAELIAHVGRGPVHFVGLSMGGMTAQALARRHGARLRSVVVAHSASHYDAAAQAAWQQRIAVVREQGMAAVAEGALQRWLTPVFMAAHPGRVAELRATLLQMDPKAYGHACDAVARIALDAGHAQIACPCLVIAGEFDAATPLAMSQTMAAQIPGSELRCIDSAHIGCIEQPQAFAALLQDFIQRNRP